MKFLNRKIRLAPLEAYNRWAASYFNESNPIKNFSDELVEKWLEDVRGKSFLDAGCGAGKICQLTEKLGASKISGVDLSPIMIEEAKKNCPKVEFACCDISKERIAGQFEFVVCALVLGHIKDLDFTLTSLLANVAPNGVLLITDFHPFLTLQGNQRTFLERKSGNTFVVENHLHLFEEYFSIILKSNAYVEKLEEPCWQGRPVVFGMKIRKNDFEPTS